MDNQTWIKSREGNFIAVDKITHVSTANPGGVQVFVIGREESVGTFDTIGDFFSAMMRGLSESEVYG